MEQSFADEAQHFDSAALEREDQQAVREFNVARQKRRATLTNVLALHGQLRLEYQAEDTLADELLARRSARAREGALLVQAAKR